MVCFLYVLSFSITFSQDVLMADAIQSPMVFDSLEPITVPVKIAGEDYILKEAGEASASRYLNELMKSTRVVESADGNKHATMDGVSNTEALLVSLCLFKVDKGGTTKNVDINLIRSWPHRIVNPLYERAESISGLKKVETEEVLIKRLKDIQEKLKKYKASAQTGEPVEGTVKN